MDRNLPGVEIADNWDVLGMRATESHDLILNDVKVPLKHLVKQRKVKRQMVWILHIPSCYLGIAQAARNYAVDFLQSNIALIVLKERLQHCQLCNKI